MNERTCTCGFEATADYNLGDHLGEIFIADDDVALDGHRHAEASPGTCLCGFAADVPVGLNGHLLAVFTPANHIGNDGNRHRPGRS